MTSSYITVSDTSYELSALNDRCKMLASDLVRTVQEYLNAQSHDGIHFMLVKFYGASEEHLHMAPDSEYKTINFEEEYEDF